MLYYV